MKSLFKIIAKILAVIATILLIIFIALGFIFGWSYVILGLAVSTWALIAAGGLLIAFVISPKGAQEGVDRVTNAVAGVAKTLAAAGRKGLEGALDGLGAKGLAKWLLGIGGVVGLFWLLSRGNEGPSATNEKVDELATVKSIAPADENNHSRDD